MIKKIGWLITFALLGVSCLDEPDCFNLRNNIVGITYKVMGSGSTDILAFDGITTEAVDSVFNPGFSGPTFSVPLNIFDTRIPFFFQGLDKHLTLGYTVRSQFVSDECGPRQVFSDLQVIDHNFDSVRIVQGIPGQDASARNVEIYRCPETFITAVEFHQLYSRSRPSQLLQTNVTGITADFTGPVVFYPATTTDVAILPLNLQAPSTSFTFDLGTGPQNVLLNYTLTTEARYRPCGVQTFISGITVKGHDFDSVSVPRNSEGRLQNLATDPPQANVRIFRCPTTNLVQIAFKTPAPSGTGTVNDQVNLVGIRTDYSAEVFYAGQTVSLVVLPVNPASNTTTFYIDYEDRTDTLVLSYARTEHRIFRACEQTVFSRLQEAVDLSNATILETDSLTFPPVTNLEILN